MKNIFIACLLSFFSAVTVGAETSSVSDKAEPPKKIANGVSRIIPQFSALVSNFTADDITFDNKFGYAIGVAADIGTGNFVAESGFLYRQIGTETRQFGNDLVLNVGYIALPILGKYYTNNEKHSSSAYVKAGVIPEFLIYKVVTGTDSGNSMPINGLELEAAAGIGGRFPMNDNNDLFLEATYNRGLSNVGATSQGGSPIYNSALLLTAGIGIDL